jgi:hypothetical protein
MVEAPRLTRAAAVWLALACSMHGATTLRYWIDPCTNPETGCHSGDPELAKWAMESWQASSDGTLVLTKGDSAASADIRIHWVTPREGLYGEARGGDVYVRPDMSAGLTREVITYLTCVHEIGHALGLNHTRDFDDIMFSFQYGGDIAEYFGRYTRRLTRREDIRKTSAVSPADKRQLLRVFR